MLIKLTAVPHPDLNGGQPYPVYIDASRILLIVRGWHEHPRIGAVERQRELYQRLYNVAQDLYDKTHNYVPDMTDPIAVGWMRTAQVAAEHVSAAYRAWGDAHRREELFHPRVECTEVQLACGTALEHGVMLTRVWVTETTEQVYEAMNISDTRTAFAGLPR